MGNAVNLTVDLTDQFHFEPSVQVMQPKYFCNPVKKIHDDVTVQIEHPDAHLVFYQINQQPPFSTSVEHAAPSSAMG